MKIKGKNIQKVEWRGKAGFYVSDESQIDYDTMRDFAIRNLEFDIIKKHVENHRSPHGLCVFCDFMLRETADDQTNLRCSVGINALKQRLKIMKCDNMNLYEVKKNG